MESKLKSQSSRHHLHKMSEDFERKTDAIKATLPAGQKSRTGAINHAVDVVYSEIVKRAT